MDSQWRRYEVFEQERPGAPHRNAGSVHAPDAELALLNARDVFVRRPDCHSLWVVPADQVYARTAEELTAEAEPLRTDPDTPLQTYLIFQKQTQRQGETFVSEAGQVQAHSAAEGLRLARAQAGSSEVFVWWLVPAQAITRSTPDDAGPMFAPARDKPFRMPNDYHVLAQMRSVLAARPEAEPPADEALA